MNNLINDGIYEIIKKLENTPGTNDKLSILRENANAYGLRNFFKMALDPHLLYGIKKIPSYRPSNSPKKSLMQAMDALFKLAERQYTGLSAIDYLIGILESVSVNNADLVERIIKKEPDCKVSHKLVNKVWPRTVPETSYMRCASANEKNYKRIEFPAFIQKKANGLFLNVVKLKGQPTFLSRNGKEYDFLGYLDRDIIDFPKDNFVMTGEALVLENDGSVMERKKGNGIIHKAQCGTITKEEADRIIVEVWDIVPYQDWVNGECKVSYEKRLSTLQKCLAEIYRHNNNSRLIKFCLIETKKVESMSEADSYFKNMIENGEEGAILKNKNGFWKNHTSPNQVKMKIKDPADLICVDVIPHSKKPEWVGSLVLESSDGIIKVSTGSGLSEDDRKKSFDYYIGKIIEIEYNEITSDKRTKQKSLFLPIYVDVRTDKDKADDYNTILERSSYKKKGK